MQNLARCLTALGASLFIGGMAWISVLNYRIRNYPEAIKYEIRLPWSPRLMMFVGLALLVILAARLGINDLHQRKLSTHER